MQSKRERKEKSFSAYPGSTGTWSTWIRLILLLPRLRRISDCAPRQASRAEHSHSLVVHLAEGSQQTGWLRPSLMRATASEHVSPQMTCARGMEG